MQNKSKVGVENHFHQELLRVNDLYSMREMRNRISSSIYFLMQFEFYRTDNLGGICVMKT